MEGGAGGIVSTDENRRMGTCQVGGSFENVILACFCFGKLGIGITNNLHYSVGICNTNYHECFTLSSRGEVGIKDRGVRVRVRVMHPSIALPFKNQQHILKRS